MSKILLKPAGHNLYQASGS